MKGSEQQVEIGDLWMAVGNNFIHPYYVLITDVIYAKVKAGTDSVYFERIGKPGRHNVTISYLYKEFRKVS